MKKTFLAFGLVCGMLSYGEQPLMAFMKTQKFLWRCEGSPLGYSNCFSGSSDSSHHSSLSYDSNHHHSYTDSSDCSSYHSRPNQKESRFQRFTGKIRQIGSTISDLGKRIWQQYEETQREAEKQREISEFRALHNDTELELFRLLTGTGPKNYSMLCEGLDRLRSEYENKVRPEIVLKALNYLWNRERLSPEFPQHYVKNNLYITLLVLQSFDTIFQSNRDHGFGYKYAIKVKDEGYVYTRYQCAINVFPYNGEENQYEEIRNSVRNSIKISFHLNNYRIVVTITNTNKQEAFFLKKLSNQKDMHNLVCYAKKGYYPVVCREGIRFARQATRRRRRRRVRHRRSVRRGCC